MRFLANITKLVAKGNATFEIVSIKVNKVLQVLKWVSICVVFSKVLIQIIYSATVQHKL